jgi:RNA polymerase sigma-70 factor (ECF subfamily)
MSSMDRTAGSTSDRTTDSGAGGFEEFFRAEHARLLRALYLVTGSVEEANEVTQDALVRVWERWDRVREMDDPTGYLYRTAMNIHRSALRRGRRAAGRVVRTGPGRDPFADSDDRDQVTRALRGLAPRQRAALVLTELLGYGSDEAGRMLGVKAVTVRALASQGRTALRSTMERTDE